MAIEIDGKIYRNIQEQVQKNKEDIESFIPYAESNVYTKEESDAKYMTEAQTDTLVSTKIADKLDRRVYFEDDDNPEEFYINYPRIYNGALELVASQDDNNHPESGYIAIKPNLISLRVSDANHGDADYDYFGAIEITNDSVKAVTNDDHGDRVEYDLLKNYYQHKYQFLFDNNDDIYLQFEVSFVSTFPEAYDTVADVFNYLLSKNTDNDIVGRAFGTGNVIPGTFGGEILADVTDGCLAFYDSTSTLYMIYTAATTLTKASCYEI